MPVGELRGGRARERDRGAIVVLSAILMVVLVGMCAFAVDVGHLFNVRRQAQSGVDAAALAGGVEMTELGVPTGDRRARAAGWVKAISYRDAEIVPATPAEWEAAWAGCTDPGHLEDTSSGSAGLTDPPWPAGGPTECISFSADTRTMRVKLPTQGFATSFGQVLGVDDMSTSAVAEVELTAAHDGGGILPFAVYAPSADATTACAAETSGAYPNELGYPYDVCAEGSTSGNFRYLDISVWGSTSRPADCSGSSKPRVELNMAEGVDHRITSWAPGDEPLDDMVECAGDRRTPNQVWTTTGHEFGSLAPGLIVGTTYAGDFYEGRLARYEGPGPREILASGPKGTRPSIDDVGLWAYLEPGLRTPDVPATCDERTWAEDWTPESDPVPGLVGYPVWLGAVPLDAGGGKPPDTFVPGNRSRLHMERCLADYAAALDAGAELPPLFTEDLAGSTRIGWLPVVDEGPNGKTLHRVHDFKLVYLNTIFGNCSNGGCANVWEPGEPSDPPEGKARRNVAMGKVQDLRAMGAYMFRWEMLPPLLRDDSPSRGGGVGGVQLSR